MDIEGDEYRIIEKLKYFKKMIGFVIEFHNIDLHHEKISYFLKKNKNFKIVHVSSNNMGGINQKNEPIVVEITFINLNFEFLFLIDSCLLPHLLFQKLNFQSRS